MRLLHLTDTHLGMQRYVRGGPPRWSRAQDHHRALLAAVDPVRWDEVDLVVHSGDFFNRSRPPKAWARKAIEVLVALARRVPVVVIAGNHDRRGLRRHLPTHVPGLTIVDQPTRLVVQDLALALVPYRARAVDWAQGARAAWGSGADLLVCHQSFDGVRVPGLTFRVGQQRETVGAQHLPAGCRWVLCGHIHPRQVVEVGDAVVVHPGSTERTAFSERHQVKGTARWTLDREVLWHFEDLDTRPMLRVEGPHHLADVVPEALIRIPRDRWTPALAQAVLDRGGWLWGAPPQATHPPPIQPAQLGLFV